MLQNGIQNFVFWLIHSWEIALQSQIFDIFWKKAQKKALALKGLINHDFLLKLIFIALTFYFSFILKNTYNYYKKKKNQLAMDYNQLTHDLLNFFGRTDVVACVFTSLLVAMVTLWYLSRNAGVEVQQFEYTTKIGAQQVKRFL